MLHTIVEYVNYYYPFYKHLPYTENLIKTSLIYKFLYEIYFSFNADIEKIISKIDQRSIRSNNPILNNHLMFYRAFKSFHKHYKIGRGCVYTFDSPINSEVLGYLTGIIYWIFHKGLK